MNMNGEFKTGPIAQQLREALLGTGDLRTAAEAAQRIANNIIDQLNKADINVATHILTVPLIARGIISATSDWWAKAFADAPTPETYAALFDLALNLPPHLIGECYDIRESGEDGR
jgi:hypothetical protein